MAKALNAGTSKVLPKALDAIGADDAASKVVEVAETFDRVITAAETVVSSPVTAVHSATGRETYEVAKRNADNIKLKAYLEIQQQEKLAILKLNSQEGHLEMRRQAVRMLADDPTFWAAVQQAHLQKLADQQALGRDTDKLRKLGIQVAAVNWGVAAAGVAVPLALWAFS
jgi:hypothetical protein